MPARCPSVPGRLTAAAAVALAGVLSAAAPARAAVAIFDINRDAQYTQLDAAGNLSLDGYFFSARAFLNGGGTDPTSATLTHPNGVDPLALVAPDLFLFQSGLFADQSALDVAFPFGTYTLDTDGVPASVSIDYTADLYPLNVPVLSASTFTALSGLNPAAPFLFQFNDLDPDPAAQEALVYLVIRDAGTLAVVFDSGPLPDGTTAYLLPANTLAANTAYRFELIFSDRLVGDDPSGVALIPEFNARTGGTFTTGAAAVPEPASLALLGFGGLALAVRRVRRRGA